MGGSVVWALAGQKGGAGKSTTALVVACELHQRGLRVLLVDADPQGTIRTFADVAAENGIAIPAVVSMGPGLDRPDQLPAMLPAFDVAVIDCPPRLDDVQRAALKVADLVVLPCGPDGTDTWALAESLDLVDAARRSRKGLVGAVLITRKREGTGRGRAARSALADCGLPVLASELGLRAAYPDAITSGQGVTTFAPSSVAAAEVRALVSELLQLSPPRK